VKYDACTTIKTVIVAKRFPPIGSGKLATYNSFHFCDTVWLYGYLHAVLLLPLQVLLVQSVDTVNHGLDKLDLGVSQSVLVGDVVGVSGLAARLSSGAAGLNSELLTPGPELVNTLLGPAGEVNVDGGPHASTQVGWAGVDVAELLGQLEVLARLSLDTVANSLDATSQAREDSLDVTALLHGDDASLVLLIDPDQESLGLVVEDATALGPVTLHTSDLKVGVTRHEEEVVVDELLADLLVHASQWVVGTSQVTIEPLQGSGDQLLNTDTLFLGDSGGKTESLDGAADTDPDRVDWDLGVDVSVDLGGIHVGNMLEVSWESVVLADQGVEDIGEVQVGVLVTSVDAAVLVVELNSASNGLGEGEARGLGDNATKLVPLLLGHVLGDQRVGGLDVGEFASHPFEPFV